MRDSILIDREKRLNKVKEFFLANPNDSLIVIKTNIPGNNKNYPFVSYLTKVFLNVLKSTYNFFFIHFYKSFDGPYFFCGIKGKDENIKKHLIKIEDSHELGRFIDLDYFINPANSLSRRNLNLPVRKCVLCNNDALYCIKADNHSTKDILYYIEKTTVLYFADVVVDLVDYSIIRELKIDHKFGLVSFSSTGSHADMNYRLMISAKDAILNYFKRMFLAGYQASGLTTLLSSVRGEGLEAERQMYAATNGVNAYKGIIFLLGITALSFGYTLKTSTDFNDIFTNIKILCANMYDDFESNYNSSGMKLYKEHNITGVRGVVKDGLQVIKDNLHKISLTSGDRELRNLLYYYILNTEDTVFITRSKSYENYLKYKEIIRKYDPNDINDLKELNKFAEKYNLSFGGAADLLITTIFLINLKELFV